MEQFITDLFLVSAKENDSSTTTLETTLKGHDGDLWDNTWTKKARRFIGFKRSPIDQYVVTDICLVAEDKDVPDDYTGLLFTKDTKEKGLRKHILCYKRDARKSTEKALTDICIINQSKGEQVPPFFTSVSQHLSEKKIAFKLEDIPKITAPQMPKITVPAKAAPVQKQSTFGSPTGGIDGVPFQINPKYDSKGLINDPITGGIQMLDINEIEKKYDYSFEKERQALQKVAS